MSEWQALWDRIDKLPRAQREPVWKLEPDAASWWTRAGFRGHLRRSPFMGSWCGYIELPPGHPWHGQGDGDWRGPGKAAGGITWRSSGGQLPVPESAPDSWLLGFDLGHAWDYNPLLDLRMRAAIGGGLGGFESEVYRDLAYAKREVEELAGQARGALRKGDRRRPKRRLEAWEAWKLPDLFPWDASMEAHRQALMAIEQGGAPALGFAPELGGEA